MAIFVTLNAADQIVEKMQLVGKTVEELAEDTGLSARTIDAILNGNTDTPREILMKVLKALQIQPKELGPKYTHLAQ